jgi:hypothetical protein
MTSRPGFWAAIDGSGNGQVVVPIDDFLLAGALAALFEQLDGICLRVPTQRLLLTQPWPWILLCHLAGM